ncbi:MAG: VWA domain-containing protein, partial [Bacillota bacterium]
FVLDTSYSLPAQAKAQAEAFVRRAIQKLRLQDRAWVIEAGERPRLAAAYAGPHLDPDGPPPSPTGDAGETTDLESALRAAGSLLAAEGSGGAGTRGRIVLISDGRETAGSVLEAARRSPGRAAGAAAGEGPALPPVHVVPVLALSRPEAAVSALAAPLSLAQGKSLRLTSRLYSSEAQPAQLRLERNGSPIWEGRVELPAGWSSVAFEDRPDGGAPAAVYALKLRAEADTHLQNNHAEAAVRVRAKDRVLYVSDSASNAGSRWLALSAGIDVEPVPPDRLPASRAELAGFSAVVLDNVAATRLTRPQMEAVAAFVRDLGGGLVVLGGPQAFGPGGYRSTPLEEVLPLWADVPARLLVPQVALVLVIDKSGSMGEQDAAGTKLDAARRAAAATLELLSPSDLVGVIAFDSQPHWVQPLEAASDPVGVMRRLGRLAADGGTELGPALREALDSLRGARAMVRHAIVLSDGKSTAADFEAVTTRAAAEGITVSAVAIGQDADVALLSDIARWGKGRFYFTRDMRRLPQIFASETITITRSALVTSPVDVVATGQAPSGEGPLPPGSRRWPRLSGYVATTPKPGASVYLAAPDGDPILASWRTGLGRVAAFTSSLTGAWGQAWQDQGLAGPMLARMVQWVMPPGPPASSNLVAELEGDRATLVAEVLDAGGRPVNFLEGTAVISGPSGRSWEVAMAQEGPGRYTARFDAAQPGEYVATARLGSVRLQAVVVRSYAAEFEPDPPSPALLAAVARATGGRVLGYITAEKTDGAPAPLSPGLAAAADRLTSLPAAAPGGWESRPAWPLLVLAGLALLLGDVAVRQVHESPAALAAEARAALGTFARGLKQRLQHLGRPGPGEVARARREARRRHEPSGTGPADAGVDPARAARLYLARLRRERRR